ncbi:uncharacterized protein [Symphalangus syndactylus]|uniref:uncharacterized protein n=1 Tax=Symphalangus syndactylus TaxID=9590 RepID=UPI003004DDF1
MPKNRPQWSFGCGSGAEGQDLQKRIRGQAEKDSEVEQEEQDTEEAPEIQRAKFFCVVEAELNHCNSMGALEMHERVEQQKQSIHRVHLYSRGEDQPLPVLGPGTPKDEKEAKTEETRTQPLMGPVNLPMPATNPAATSATTTTMVSVVTPSPPGTWGCLACLKPTTYEKWKPPGLRTKGVRSTMWLQDRAERGHQSQAPPHLTCSSTAWAQALPTQSRPLSPDPSPVK